MATSGSLVPYLLGNPVLTANAIANNTIYTTVSNSTNSGAATTSTYTTVNVVPNTYLTSALTTTWTASSGLVLFATGLTPAGIYVISFTGSALTLLPGTATDYFDIYVYSASGGTIHINRVAAAQTVGGLSAFSGIVTIKPTANQNIYIKADFYGTTTYTSLTINPYVTIQKIA